MYVYTAQQFCAHSRARLSILLLTMCADEMLSYNPVSQTVLLQESGYEIQLQLKLTGNLAHVPALHHVKLAQDQKLGASLTL